MTTKMTTVSRNWSMLAHCSASLFHLFLPSLGVLGPLIIYIIKRSDADVSYHARQAIAFQLAILLGTWTITALGTALSCFLVGFVLYVPGLLLLLAGIVVPIIAAMRVNDDLPYRYPVTGHLVVQDPPRIA